MEALISLQLMTTCPQYCRIRVMACNLFTVDNDLTVIKVYHKGTK